MGLTAMRLFSRLFGKKVKATESPRPYVATFAPDPVGKYAYFVPPGSTEISAAIGCSRIKAFDAINGQFYFDEPMPKGVGRDWIIVIGGAPN